jgi:hypothetical protein
MADHRFQAARTIDRAEDHHDIALADHDGKLLARRRISDDAAGLAQLRRLGPHPAHNRLRSHLREYFPGFLAAFAAAKGGINRPRARTILAAALAPADAARLTTAQLRGLLKRAGRSRGIDAEATRPREAFASCRCACSPSSNKPWATRPWPCSPCSTPPARPQTTPSPLPPRNLPRQLDN